MSCCDNHDCRQGRDCPHDYPAASLTVYAVVFALAVAGLVLWVIA